MTHLSGESTAYSGRKIGSRLLDLIGIAMLLCFLSISEKTMESDASVGVPANQCPVCEKVFSKSSTRYDVARHMKSVHGMEEANALLRASSSQGALSLAAKQEVHRKEQGTSTSPLIRGVPTIEELRRVKLEPRSPVKLRVTTTDAKNIPKPKAATIVQDGEVKDVDSRPEELIISKLNHSRHTEVNTERTMRISREQAVQTLLIDWEQIGREIGFLIRLFRMIHSVKTPEELFELGRKECPDLEPVVVQGIVAAHFPMGQYPGKKMEKTALTRGTVPMANVDNQFATSQKDNESTNVSKGPRGLQLKTENSDSSDDEMMESSGRSTLGEEDLCLSGSDDSSIVMYTSSDED